MLGRNFKIGNVSVIKVGDIGSNRSGCVSSNIVLKSHTKKSVLSRTVGRSDEDEDVLLVGPSVRSKFVLLTELEWLLELVALSDIVDSFTLEDLSNIISGGSLGLSQKQLSLALLSVVESDESIVVASSSALSLVGLGRRHESLDLSGFKSFSGGVDHDTVSFD